MLYLVCSLGGFCNRRYLQSSRRRERDLIVYYAGVFSSNMFTSLDQSL